MKHRNIPHKQCSRNRLTLFMLTCLITGLSIISQSFFIKANAQVRPNLSSFSAADQATLVNLMEQYITSDVVEDHCNYEMKTGDNTLDIHSDVNFLPFHRGYLEGMEDFLILQGFPQFVPLPCWDPNTTAPASYLTVDGSCPTASTTCMHGVTNNPAIDCSTAINGSPGIARPSYLSLPVQVGTNNDLCDWPFTTGPGGLSRVIESSPNNAGGNYHNSVHNAMMGAMRQFTSPSVPIFWNWHGYVDDIWKEYQCACPGSSATADLYMKDTPKIPHNERDLGAEPDPDPGPMWVSEDIWIRNTSDGFTTDEHQNPEYRSSNSLPNYIYVRVRNRGCVANTGTGGEVLRVYWSKASTGLVWPTHWDNYTIGSVTYGDEATTTPVTITSITAGDMQIFQIPWYPPNPADFNETNSHVCVVARIETSTSAPFGMTFAEGTNIYDNTRNNNNIVWKNCTVVDNVPGIQEPIFVDIHNTQTTQNCAVRFNFTVPEDEHDNSFLDHGTVTVDLGPILFKKWQEGGQVGDGIELVHPDRIAFHYYNDALDPLLGTHHNARPHLKILNPDAYIGNICLEAEERLPVAFRFIRNVSTELEFNPDSNLIDTMLPPLPKPEKAVRNRYHFDFIQINEVDGTQEIVGGERYIINMLTDPSAPARKPSQQSKDNQKRLAAFANQLSVFPNPAKTKLTIICSKTTGTQTARLYSMLGQELYRNRFREELRIDVSVISKGMYILEISSDETHEKYIKKIIIE